MSLLDFALTIFALIALYALADSIKPHRHVHDTRLDAPVDERGSV